MKATSKEKTFEELLTALENIVMEMEAGGLTLEKSIALYEQGAEIEKRLQAQLELSKQRITMLIRQKDETVEAPMKEESEQ